VYATRVLTSKAYCKVCQSNRIEMQTDFSFKKFTLCRRNRTDGKKKNFFPTWQTAKD